MLIMIIALQSGAGMTYEPATADRAIAVAATAERAIERAQSANPVQNTVETSERVVGGVWPRPTISAFLRAREDSSRSTGK